MSYLALYRKYRPRNFDEVVGQTETTEILKNQISLKKFGHAYLFSGIRGTGKTSTAKIMAKAVNCLNPSEGNPCNACENCLEINNESFMDVIEIDAASNNGVDNVRELRENSKYLPSKGSHKVYIIDEVQMLSTGAFNALLKTLEEPSEHVVFILATTEPEKIPVTILSRCQRYDFKRIRLEDMIQLIRKILADLEYTYEDEALELIALKSDGAMRDALSLLEKVISKADQHISEQLTSSVLGMVEFVVLSELFAALDRGEIETAMQATVRMVDAGISVSHILEQMLSFVRGMMLSKVFQKPSEIIGLPVQLQERLIENFSHIELPVFSKMIEVINETLSKLKYAANPRLSLELAVVSLSLLFVEEPVKQEPRTEKQPVRSAPLKAVEPPAQNPIPPTAPKPPMTAAPKPAEQKLPQKQEPSRQVEERPEPEQAKPVASSNQQVIDQWQVILELVKKERRIAHAFLIEGNPVSEDNGKVTIEFRPEFNFHMENVMLPENKKIIENVIMAHTGRRYSIETTVAGKTVKKKVVPEKKEKNDVDKVKEFLGEEFQDILTVK